VNAPVLCAGVCITDSQRNRQTDTESDREEVQVARSVTAAIDRYWIRRSTHRRLAAAAAAAVDERDDDDDDDDDNDAGNSLQLQQLLTK